RVGSVWRDDSARWQLRSVGWRDCLFADDLEREPLHLAEALDLLRHGDQGLFHALDSSVRVPLPQLLSRGVPHAAHPSGRPHADDAYRGGPREHQNAEDWQIVAGIDVHIVVT